MKNEGRLSYDLVRELGGFRELFTYLFDVFRGK